MIEANELRIGNWVRAILPNKPWKVDDLVIYHIVSGNIQSVYDTSPIYGPIRITPEILEKCKFSWNGIQIYRMEGYYSVQANQWVADEENEIATFEYVHQLQNLHFALTGREVEIDLIADSIPAVSVGKKLKETNDE